MEEVFKKFFTHKPDDKSLVLKEPYYAEIRIPIEMFDKGIANIFGDTVSTFFFVDIYIWDEYTDVPLIKDATKINIRIPNILSSRPTRIKYDSKNSENILEFMPNDQVIMTTMVPKKSEVVVEFFEIMLDGKIPDDIPYNEISGYFEECARINGVNLRANSLYVDAMVASICRDPNNNSRQFKELIAENPKVSMYSRKVVNADLIPSMTSQFNAITNSNPKYGITSSIGAVRSGDMEIIETDIDVAIK